MPAQKIHLGPKACAAVDALVSIAESFKSIAASLERIADPPVATVLEQRPNMPGEGEEHPCVCGEIKFYGDEVFWREPGTDRMHRAAKIGDVECDPA